LGSLVGHPRTQAEAKAAPIPEASSVADVPTIPAAEPVFVASVMVPAPAAAVQDNPPVAPFVPVTPVAAAVPVPVAPAPRSIVEQVDEILQEKLAGHPAPVPTIRLVEDPQEGVVVVGQQNEIRGDRHRLVTPMCAQSFARLQSSGNTAPKNNTLPD